MIKVLIIASLFVSCLSQCDLQANMLYYGVCTPKECVGKMTDTLKSLTSFQPYVAGSNGFSIQSTYTSGSGFSINLRWPDGVNKTWMLGRPNCVTYYVYQNSDGTQNAQRISAGTDSSPDGTFPTWPSASYSQDANNYQGSITVTYSANDVANKCTRDVSAPVPTYTCYFELAFLVAGMTQSSNYFSSKIIFYANQAQITLDITKMTTTTVTTVNQVNVSTIAQVYTVYNNDGSVGAPATTVQLGKPYYIQLRANDTQFSSWKFNNISVFSNDSSFSATYDFSVVYNQGGRAVLQIMPSLVFKKLKINVYSILTPTRRLLADSNASTYVVENSIDAPVVVDPSQPCDFTSSYLYFGKCVKNVCLDKMIPTLKSLTTIGQYVDGAPTQFSIQTNYLPNIGFSIQLSWLDGQNNVWMLGDPQNCVDHALFQMSDGTNQATRVNVQQDLTPDGQSPLWPRSGYTQNQTAYQGIVSTTFTANDVAKYCNQNSPQQYTCYFELAFRVAGMTQSSNYFSLQINFNANGASLLLDITKLTTVSKTFVNPVNITTSAQLYSVFNTNDNTVGAPASKYIVGDKIYIDHRITDQQFSSWRIVEPSVYYVTPQLTGEASKTVVYSGSGRNVYQITAFLAISQAQLRVQARVQSARRILQTDNSTYITQQTLTSPEVVDNKTSVPPQPPIMCNETNTTTNLESSLLITSTQSTTNPLLQISAGGLYYLRLKTTDQTLQVANQAIFYNVSGVLKKVPFTVTSRKQGSSVYSVKATIREMSQKPICVIATIADAQKHMIVACSQSPLITVPTTTVAVTISNDINFTPGRQTPAIVREGTSIYIRLRLTQLAQFQLDGITLSYGKQKFYDYSLESSPGETVITISASKKIGGKTFKVTGYALSPLKPSFNVGFTFPQVK